MLQKTTEDAQKKCAVIAYMGPTAFSKLNHRIQPEKSAKDLSFKEIVEIVQTIFEPQKNVWSSRIEFRKMSQTAGESLLEFEGRLRKACIDGKWSAEDLQANLVEQFIAGVHDGKVRKSLLMQCADKKKLSEVVTLAENITQAQRASDSISNGNGHVGVNKLSNAAKSVKNWKSSERMQHPASKNHQGNRKLAIATVTKQSQASCYRCGDGSHMANVCPFKSVRCRSCNMNGHLQKMCMKSRHHFLEDIPFDLSCNYLKSKEAIKLKVLIENKPIIMEVDTGSGISTMAREKFNELLPAHQLYENDIRLRTATGESFMPHSYAKVLISVQGFQKQLRIYLFDQKDFPTLMGRSWMQELDLDWTQIIRSTAVMVCSPTPKSTDDFKKLAKEVLTKYPNLTKPGIGRIPSMEAQLELTTPDPKPVYLRARPVAHAMIQKTDEELDHLEQNDIIERIPVSDWAQPIVVVPRANGKKVRICGDFKVGINKYLKLEEYPLKNIRHALDNIGNGAKFSKLDISAAFLHMPVRESDQKFLVVNTHRGLYRFKRMSNGLANAPAVWQKYIEGVLAGINGTECVIDDIIITGATDEEHLQRLEEVLRRLNEQNIRLNADKCAFFEKSVTYCGFKLQSQEIHKCPDKIEAIQNAPSPENVSDLKSFLGLIQFYASFAPRLAELARPLYDLLKSSAKFHWSAEKQQAFEAVKKELCSPSVLVPFDSTKPLLLATDASPWGIAAVLSHRFPDETERPIAYYSRMLTDTERKYSQIDKEALGIKCGVEKFFYYLFGRRFTLITDSRPLVQIFSPDKGLPALSATRMQHYSIYLTGFNFDIIYRSTHQHGNVDALARLPVKSEQLQEMDSSDAVYN